MTILTLFFLGTTALALAIALGYRERWISAQAKAQHWFDMYNASQERKVAVAHPAMQHLSKPLRPRGANPQ